MPIPARCCDYIINCILHNVVRDETGARVVLVCPEVGALNRPHEGGFLERKIMRQTGQRSVQDWSFALEYFLKLNSVVSVHGFGLRQERQWRNLQTRPEWQGPGTVSGSWGLNVNLTFKVKIKPQWVFPPSSSDPFLNRAFKLNG